MKKQHDISTVIGLLTLLKKTSLKQLKQRQRIDTPLPIKNPLKRIKRLKKRLFRGYVLNVERLRSLTAYVVTAVSRTPVCGVMVLSDAGKRLTVSSGKPRRLQHVDVCRMKFAVSAVTRSITAGSQAGKSDIMNILIS